MCVQLLHTKHVAERLAQSKLKKVAVAVLSCAFLFQNNVFEQIGQIKVLPIISICSGSDFVKSPMFIEFDP